MSEKPKKPENREELMEGLEWLANDTITNLTERYGKNTSIQPMFQSTIESIRTSKDAFIGFYADKMLKIANTPEEILETFEGRLGLLTHSLSEHAEKYNAHPAAEEVQGIVQKTKRKLDEAA